MVLNLDMNERPPIEHDFLTNSSFDGTTNLQLGLPQAHTPYNFMQVESADDEVVICSPRSFAEAREKSRRNRQVIELIDDAPDHQRGYSAGESSGETWQRIATMGQRRADRLNLESHEKTGVPAESVPKPTVPIFNCPVCIGQIFEETSTKCGHIFCKKCINTALTSQKKCPTCRRKLKPKDTFRIYLPNSE